MPYKDTEIRKQWQSEYYEKNRNTLKMKRRQRYQKNREKEIRNTRNWIANNKEKYRQLHTSYCAKRTSEDIQFRLTNVLRSRLKVAIKKRYRVGSAVDLLGCTTQMAVLSIASKWKPGMNWSNHGRGKGKWHIDHIQPLSSFDLADLNQLAVVCHISNLQPLWQEDNVRKGNR